MLILNKMIQVIKVNICFGRKKCSLSQNEFYIQCFSPLFEIHNWTTESLRKKCKNGYTQNKNLT
jgi:hypothetical protein